MDFKRFVNEIYLKEDVLREMRKIFSVSCVLKLEGFLREEVFKELVKMLINVRGENIKVPDRYSFDVLESLSGVEKLFLSREIIHFVNVVGGKDFDDVKLEILGFGHRDYTLLHDSETREGTEFFFVFSDVWSDDWGGQIVFSDNNESGKTLIFPIAGNSFVIIDRKGLGNFVKYINHLAGERRFLLIKGKFK